MARLRSLWLPAVVLPFTSAPALPPPQPEPRVIEVVARRFAFEPPAIEVAVGERVRLVVRSADGVHGVEIKRFRVNREIPRGATPVRIEFTADEAGRFPILCSEYCGEGHDEMSGTLVVSATGPPGSGVRSGSGARRSR